MPILVFADSSPFSDYLKSKTSRDWSDWPIMVLFLDWFPEIDQIGQLWFYS